MVKFTIKRILSALLALFVLSTVTFFLMHLVPGGPFNAEKMNAKTVAIMEAKYGFNRPLGEQYLDYLSNLVKGDLGISVKRIGYTVNEIITEKFATSARLGAVAICLAVLMGIPMGTLAAQYRNRIPDRVIMFVCTIGVSVPSFIMATLLLYFFGINLEWFPIMRLDTPLHYVLPAFALSLSPTCYITRFLRSAMLDTQEQDFIRTARAKGLSRLKINFKHVMRNSIIPVVTYLGPLTASILGGGMVVEKVFSIAGLGSYFIQSINGRDYPVIMGITIFYGILLVVANFVVDILYGVIDPRIKHY